LRLTPTYLERGKRMGEPHCDRDDCDCQRRDIDLDYTQVQAAARERGVALPVDAHRSRNLRNGDRGLKLSALAGCVTWGSVEGCANRHEIVIRPGLTAQETLSYLLHELEHCVQAESFEDWREWDDIVLEGIDILHEQGVEAYQAEGFEAAAMAVEQEWIHYGHLLVPESEEG
jgi:hypothetical protein